MALITAAEVITAAFNRSIGTELILDSVIEAAEWKYIRPALTENLYDEVVADPAGANYTTLVDDYLQPCLAQFVKYMAYDEIIIKVTDLGAFQANEQNSNAISNATKNDGKDSVLEIANSLANKMVDYINQQVLDDVTAFSDHYKDLTDVVTEDEIIGGIFIPGKKYISIENE